MDNKEQFIPKIVHFTWFSNDPFPEDVKACMESWKLWLPDYEFIHWDMEKISDIDNLFLKQALERKKWAFAADFVRQYAIYHHGGIYIDTDVEVYKSFDDLLTHKAFIGRESSMHLDGRRAVRYLTSHCMGGEKHHPFFKASLDYYADRPFVLSHQEWLPDNLKYDQTTLPEIQFEIACLQGYNPSDKVKGVQLLENGLAIYPNKYFDYFYQVKESYIRHLALGAWRSGSKVNINPTRDMAKRRLYVALNHVTDALGVAVFGKK